MAWNNPINEHSELLGEYRNNYKTHSDMYPPAESQTISRFENGATKLDDLMAAHYVRNRCRLISRPWGKFNVVRKHAASVWSRRLLRDFYHTLLDLPFWQMMTFLSLIFLMINVIFALLFMAGGDCVEEVDHRSFSDNFFFSVQTIQTIGYGAMVPRTRYSNSVMVIESWLGTIMEAALVGLMFAKFSRPTRIRRGVLFSKVAVISPVSSADFKTGHPIPTKITSDGSEPVFDEDGGKENNNPDIITTNNIDGIPSPQKSRQEPPPQQPSSPPPAPSSSQNQSSQECQQLILRIANTRRTQLCEAKFSLLLVDNGYRFCHDEDPEHVSPATSPHYESCIPIKQSEQSILKRAWETINLRRCCFPTLRRRIRRNIQPHKNGSKDQPEIKPPVYSSYGECRAASSKVHMYDGHTGADPYNPYFGDIRIHELSFEINDQTGRTRDISMSSPLLPLPWSITHVIDSQSPLYGISKEEFVRRDFEIVAVLEGIDEGCSDNIQARWSYKPHEIVWDARFVPMIRRDQQQPYIIDFARFSQVEPIE
eukprot:gb/GECH01004616.1/.p1 GENE.gb/GECH01004616.1/~~gb/GECH01004616.1/.p1  ORF type:complete len:539 (+),score=93.16 gb/GECH01004616.1/:1-1617(+)